MCFTIFSLYKQFEEVMKYFHCSGVNKSRRLFATFEKNLIYLVKTLRYLGVTDQSGDNLINKI
jgi:hypothetical protein